jgi:hypothetical protein
MPDSLTTKPAKLLLQESKLNQASQDLLDQLPDHVGQLVTSLAKQTYIPQWQLVCGVLLAVHQEGRLSEFRLDPAWKDGLRTKELVCQYAKCGKTFTPKRIAQKYCSTECGLKADGMWKIPETKPNANILPANNPSSADWIEPLSSGGVA